MRGTGIAALNTCTDRICGGVFVCAGVKIDAAGSGAAPKRRVLITVRVKAVSDLLARVDGTSPVDYLTEEGQRDQARRLGRALLLERPATWDDVLSLAALN